MTHSLYKKSKVNFAGGGKVNAVILAGGRASRMGGKDKVFLAGL